MNTPIKNATSEKAISAAEETVKPAYPAVPQMNAAEGNKSIGIPDEAKNKPVPDSPASGATPKPAPKQEQLPSKVPEAPPVKAAAPSQTLDQSKAVDSKDSSSSSQQHLTGFDKTAPQEATAALNRAAAAAAAQQAPVAVCFLM